MIFTMDVGNTNIKTAVFDGRELKNSWRISTNRVYTSDEYGLILTSLFERAGLDPAKIDGVVMSSVVPSVNYTLEHMCRDYLGKKPLVINSQLNLGIRLHYDNPSMLGSDRIANAVGAQAEYGGPCIFIDFGTATTFGAIGPEGDFLGGCICPGFKLTSEALVAGTAKLPRFELIKPDKTICTNTVENLQSGVVYGYIGQVDYLVQRFRREMNAPKALVVATGGMARMVAEEGGIIDRLDSILTLKGLRVLYERNS